MADFIPIIETVAHKERVRTRRAALRARGLRPVTRWLPDTSDPAFVAEYQRQAAAVAHGAHAQPEQESAFWESVQVEEGWE